MRISDWSSDVCSSDLSQHGTNSIGCATSPALVRNRFVIFECAGHIAQPDNARCTVVDCPHNGPCRAGRSTGQRIAFCEGRYLCIIGQAEYPARHVLIERGTSENEAYIHRKAAVLDKNV